MPASVGTNSSSFQWIITLRRWWSLGHRAHALTRNTHYPSAAAKTASHFSRSGTNETNANVDISSSRRPAMEFSSATTWACPFARSKAGNTGIHISSQYFEVIRTYLISGLKDCISLTRWAHVYAVLRKITVCLILDDLLLHVDSVACAAPVSLKRSRLLHHAIEHLPRFGGT
jgi:hypothetical protein